MDSSHGVGLAFYIFLMIRRVGSDCGQEAVFVATEVFPRETVVLHEENRIQ